MNIVFLREDTKYKASGKCAHALPEYRLDTWWWQDVVCEYAICTETRHPGLNLPRSVWLDELVLATFSIPHPILPTSIAYVNQIHSVDWNTPRVNLWQLWLSSFNILACHFHYSIPSIVEKLGMHQSVPLIYSTGQIIRNFSLNIYSIHQCCFSISYVMGIILVV